MTAPGTNAARLLRVYGAWIVLITAVVTAAAVGVGMAAKPKYLSEAVVVVEARVRANTTPLAPDMGTEKELAQSGLVVDPVARALSITPAELLAELVVSVAPDANVLTFSYSDASAATAQLRADALARAYIAYRNAGEAKEARDAAAAKAAADKAVAKGETPPPAVAGTPTSTQHATLVTPAPLPASAEQRPIWIDAAVGVGIGLLLGIGTALIRDRLSDRLRGRDDFERVAGITVLATVPRLRGRLKRNAHRSVVLRAPDSPAAESFRYLRSRLQPLLAESGATIMVTSAGEREGRTTTAANLAAALALSGQEVIVVDTDLERPGLHTALGCANDVGLTGVLVGDRTVTEALHDCAIPRLRVLPAGPPAGNMADLLKGDALRRLALELRGRCDVVVLDSAPVLSVSDAIALAAVSDHILLVADYRRTTRKYVTRALNELGGYLGRGVSGVLLNAPRSAGGLTPQGRLPQLAARSEAPGTGPATPPPGTVPGNSVAVPAAGPAHPTITEQARAAVRARTAAQPIVVAPVGSPTRDEDEVPVSASASVRASASVPGSIPSRPTAVGTAQVPAISVDWVEQYNDLAKQKFDWSDPDSAHEDGNWFVPRPPLDPTRPLLHGDLRRLRRP